LLLYQLVEATGAVRGIRDAVAALTEDHILQLLIIGVAFASFLQGVQGFGVPVAVTAPLLLGLGFAPLEAAAAPLVGHSWAVTTGTLASALQALRAVTGLPVRPMAAWIGVLLGLAAVLTCFAVVHLHAGWRPMRRAFGAILAMGLVMAGSTSSSSSAATGRWPRPWPAWRPWRWASSWRASSAGAAPACSGCSRSGLRPKGGGNRPGRGPRTSPRCRSTWPSCPTTC
ncbi:MAG: L-lactate permease, partial [Armatimonadota bacterium]|nr:L-lactate permease [Armatimonadota bacterium]